MSVPAQNWNRLAHRCRSGRPLRGAGVSVIGTPSGSMVFADPSGGFEHPWKLSAIWREEAWRVFVRPGFVNGFDATIAMESDGGSRDIGLTDGERPYLTPGWRNPLKSAGPSATADGELVPLAAEGYPKFFEAIGVREPDRGGRDPAPHDPNAAERDREIRACDIVLAVPRVATVQDVEVHDPLLESQSITIGTRFVNSYAASVDSPYRLRAAAKWQPPQEPTMLDRLLGLAVEPQTDEIKIATLWMVSPPAPEGGEDAVPDGTWVPFPQYSVFWNLAHAPRRAVPHRPPDPITLLVPLAGGVAQPLINALLSGVNDAYNQIDAFLNSTTFKGEFWTV